MTLVIFIIWSRKIGATNASHIIIMKEKFVNENRVINFASSFNSRCMIRFIDYVLEDISLFYSKENTFICTIEKKYYFSRTKYNFISENYFEKSDNKINLPIFLEYLPICCICKLCTYCQILCTMQCSSI